MNQIALQISPEAKSAYFADYLTVAQQELALVMGDIPFTYHKHGPLEFFELPAESDAQKLLKLSFAQGLYAMEDGLLRPLDLSADFRLHEDFVFGNKYRGKTNERLTQMLINVGLASIGATSGDGIKLLDPMCGRGTTLIWAMRYGCHAKGIEQDADAIEDIRRHLKKWTKLHRQKHQLTEGVIAGGKKKNKGAYLDFLAQDSSLRLIVGDAREADQIFKKDKFDLLVCDLPYGVQHFTTENTRNPLSILDQCATAWKNCLKQKGVMVLSFNRNNPKRDELIKTFEHSGLQTHPFTAAHRMSESIVRDVVVFSVKP